MILAIVITIILFTAVSAGLRAFERAERSVRARNRKLPPRDARGRFCGFYTVSQMRRDVGGGGNL